MTGHIFISYARKDGRNYAERLDRELQAAGFKTWRDTRDLDPHQDFSAELEKAIEGSARVVCCITPDVKREDSFVRREIGYTLRLKKPIVPLIFDSTVPPIQVVNVTDVDFTHQQWEMAFDELKGRLERLDTSSAQVRLPDDSFREYLHALYDQIVYYLNQTVFALITLKGESTPDAVDTSQDLRRNVLPMAFLSMAGIESQPQKPKSYHNFHDAVKDFEGRVLLLGEPGAGKTTTVFAYARDAVAKRLEDPTQPLPLLAPIATWDAQQKTPLVDWLVSQIPALKRDDIHKVIDEGKALLLLDGLDELGAEREEKTTKEKFDPRVRVMEMLAPHLLHNPLIVSCRVKDYQEIGTKIALKGAVTLQPLNDDQMQEYLSKLPELWEALQSDNELRKVAQTPLLLSLFTFAYRGSNPKELEILRNIRNSPKDLRDKIFETFVQKRFEHEKRKPFSKITTSVPELYEVLGVLAIDNLDFQYKDTNKISLESVDYIFENTNYEVEKVIEDANLLSIIVQTGKATFSFAHLLLRDYFAYTYCIKNFVGSYEDNHSYNKYNTAIDLVEALSNLKDNRSIPMLIECLNYHDTHNYIVRDAIFAIGEIGDKRAVEPLIEKLHHPSENIRRLAAETLGELADTRAIDVLGLMLFDNHPTVRESSAYALGRMGKDAIYYLLIARKDEEKYVSSTAKNAIDKLFNTLDDDEKDLTKSVLYIDRYHLITHIYKNVNIQRKEHVKKIIIHLLNHNNLYVRKQMEKALKPYYNISYFIKTD
jgi:DNA polymerase III delta prime subunit